MAVNRGKQFEDIVKDCFEKVPDTVVVRIHDQTTGFYGSKNPCDFLIYRKPLFMALECKSVHGNILSFTNITDYQWEQLSKIGSVPGVIAGVMCWWVDRDVTLFIPIQMLEAMKNMGKKSIRYDECVYCDSSGNGYVTASIQGKKKRVFFDYDMEQFLKEVTTWQK